MTEHAFSPLIIKGRTLLPIVQGGMGVGVSAHQLAGAVAKEGSGHYRQCRFAPSARRSGGRISQVHRGADYDRLNLIALDREVKAALDIAQGHGMVSVNVMKAVDSHAAYVRQACRSSRRASHHHGRWPAADLPEMVQGYPDVALLPILSESRGIGIVIKRWMKKNRLPDAIVIEHPSTLAATWARRKKKTSTTTALSSSACWTKPSSCSKPWAWSGKIPLIVAGGVNSYEKSKPIWAGALPACRWAPRLPSPTRATPIQLQKCWPTPSRKTSSNS